ncbi:hypothetical protein BV898_04500 [Hypsibius exemplaris]|uniref:Uncharacterized protein n=1 Tax=Hypsibius exemplaris TaxID=2072580 RepID=A0A1W0X2E4_HYPEX|nr:hypothetical protein BV898_04500 [Hypsibius exemplaris]
MELAAIEKEVKQIVVPDYWSNKNGRIKLSSFGVCKEQLRLYSARRMTANNQDGKVLPEHIVILETLCMLEGFDTSVYQLVDGCYSVSPDVSLVDLNHTLLKDILQPLAERGSKLTKLYAFAELTEQHFPGAVIDGRRTALFDFVLCVDAFCKDIRVFLGMARSEMETLVSQGRPYSVLTFVQALTGIFQDVDVIYGVFQESMRNGVSPTANYSPFTEYILLEIIRTRLADLWRTDNATNYGLHVGRMFSLVRQRYGCIQLLSYAEMSGAGEFRDLCDQQNQFQDGASDDHFVEPAAGIAIPRKQPEFEIKNPLLRQHFASLHGR